MPKKDKTFTGKDVIRIWFQHLDKQEQAEVVCFFVDISPVFFGLPGQLPDGIFAFVAKAIIGIVPVGGTAIKVLEAVQTLLPTLKKRCDFFKKTGAVVSPREFTITFPKPRR